MAYCTVDGVRVWYEVSGKGPPLALIGGFALIDSQWEFCVDELRKNHTVINYAFRGTGKSDWTSTTPPCLEHYVEDLRAVLDAAGIPKTAIWCTSTGAPIGIRFAAKYPERMTALVTYPWFKSDDTWRGVMQTAYMTAKHYGIGAMSRLFAGAVFPPELLYAKEGTEYEQWAKKVYERNVNPTTLQKVIEAYCEVDLTGDVPRIQCPTMLLMGKDSALNEQEAMKEVSFEYLMSTFRALKPDVETGIIEGAGSTYCMVTKPKACAETAMNFLARVVK